MIQYGILCCPWRELILDSALLSTMINNKTTQISIEQPTIKQIILSTFTINNNKDYVPTSTEHPQAFSLHTLHNLFTSISIFHRTRTMKLRQAHEIKLSFIVYLRLWFSCFVSMSSEKCMKNVYSAVTKKCCATLKANDAYLSFIIHSNICLIIQCTEATLVLNNLHVTMMLTKNWAEQNLSWCWIL